MNHWEYNIIEAGAHLSQDQLNEFGADGWELVVILSYGLSFFHTFKRPLLLS